MPTDLIIYAIVAAGLIFWLRSVLGTRHGDERERPNPFTTPTPDNAETTKLFDDASLAAVIGEGKLVLPRNVSIVSEKVEQALKDLMKNDPDFDPATFSQAAQDAFVIIVESFAAGDRDTLKNLLEPNVFNAFDGALSQREKTGESMSTEIHAVRKAEILDCRVENKTSYIAVRFIADETCIIRDSGGSILSGDPDRITEMNDIWTFSRPLRSRDPRWLVHETRDGDVQEAHKTPVPDSL